MEIEFKGANCVVITHNRSVLVTDPNLSDVGLKNRKQLDAAMAQLLTEQRFEAADYEGLTVRGPGEYEINNMTVIGAPAPSHRDPNIITTAYRLEGSEITVGVLGHAAPKLPDDVIEQLGLVDILILPVGGYGYTLDAKSAADIVKEVEPKMVIPTHFADKGSEYEVQQADVSEFIKELGVPVENISKLKLKSAAAIPESLTVYVLERS